MVDRELYRGTPEVHVAGVCVRRSNDGRTEILVVRRGESRSLYPGMLSGVGGQVLRGESFEEAVLETANAFEIFVPAQSMAPAGFMRLAPLAFL